MPKKGKRKQKKSDGEQWGNVRLGQFRLSFPQPRLPQFLGSTKSLAPRNAIYPANVGLDVPFTPNPVAITAGSVTVNQNLDLSQINAFASRFASLFREYCIVGARVEIRLNVMSASAQGVVKAWIDEDSAAAPTLSNALNRATLDIALVGAPIDKVYVINWKPLDYLDLDWTDTGTTFTPAFLKLYGTTSTGLAAASAGQLIVTGTLAFCFRGYV